jgi:hypothetical protein
VQTGWTCSPTGNMPARRRSPGQLHAPGTRQSQLLPIARTGGPSGEARQNARRAGRRPPRRRAWLEEGGAPQGSVSITGIVPASAVKRMAGAAVPRTWPLFSSHTRGDLFALRPMRPGGVPGIISSGISLNGGSRTSRAARRVVRRPRNRQWN